MNIPRTVNYSRFFNNVDDNNSKYETLSCLDTFVAEFLKLKI